MYLCINISTNCFDAWYLPRRATFNSQHVSPQSWRSTNYDVTINVANICTMHTIPFVQDKHLMGVNIQNNALSEPDRKCGNGLKRRRPDERLAGSESVWIDVWMGKCIYMDKTTSGVHILRILVLSHGKHIEPTYHVHYIYTTNISAFPGRDRHFTGWTRLCSSHGCHPWIHCCSFIFLPCSACGWVQISRWNKDYLLHEVRVASLWQKRWQYLRKGKETTISLTLLFL